MVASVVSNQTAVQINLKRRVNKCFGGIADLLSESGQNQKPLLSLSCLTLLCIPLLLYTFRSFDDNRLVSWVWAFTQPQFSQPQLFSLLAVLFLALALLFVVVSSQWRVSVNVTSLTIISFLITIPFWQTPEIIIDNARYFTQAKYVELYGVGYFFQQWGQGIFAWTDLPLLPLIYGLAFKLFGEHRAVIQVLGSVFFAGTVAVTYFLGKILWDSNHGTAAATLLLGIPYLYSQIPLMMVDIPTMFFLTLAVLASVLAMKQGGYGYIVFAAMTIVVALFTKYSAWIFLSVIPFAVFSQPQSVWCKSFTRLFKIAFAVTILLSLVLYWYYPVLVEQFNTLLNYQWGALDGWQEGYVSTFLFHVHPLISIAAFVSLLLAIKHRDKKFLIVSWMLILIMLLDIQRIRYVMIIFPMLTLMAGYSVAKIPNKPLKNFLVCGIVLTSYGIAWSMSSGFLQNTSANNLKSAGAYLDTLNVEFVEVLVLLQRHSIVNPQIAVSALDYHTNKTLLYRDGDSLSHADELSNITKSPVRFTWEYPMPPYYHHTKKTDRSQTAVAVIYSDQQQLASKELQFRLADYQLLTRFQAQTGVFKYKTLINLYVPG
jgi:hypothetical protein